MSGLVFVINLKDNSLSIRFNEHFTYFKQGETRCTKKPDDFFKQTVLSLFEHMIPKLRLFKSDRLWSKQMTSDVTYFDLNLRKSVFLQDDINRHNILKKMNIFMNHLKAQIKKDFILTSSTYGNKIKLYYVI